MKEAFDAGLRRESNIKGGTGNGRHERRRSREAVRRKTDRNEVYTLQEDVVEDERDACVGERCERCEVNGERERSGVTEQAAVHEPYGSKYGTAERRARH